MIKRTTKKQAKETPWGPAQSVENIAPGLTFYSTASHGGYHLSPDLNTKVPQVLKEASFMGNGMRGWYEEDCDWAIVVYCFKEHFEEERYHHAVESLKSFHTAAWDRLHKDEKRNYVKEVAAVYEQIFSLPAEELQEALYYWWDFLNENCTPENPCIECLKELETEFGTPV